MRTTATALPTLVTFVVALAGAILGAQATPAPSRLDARVKRFLEGHKDAWHEMNVPEADGRALQNLIVERRYRRVLEVGTSTGRSAIWMAWALSRTGGRLTTIEIDESRHRQALENIRATDLSPFVDARLGDAHRVVRQLAGTFDMVFVDADKDGFVDYARALWPKLARGGALTAHNVERAAWPGSDTPVIVSEREFYEFVTRLPGAQTEFREGVFVAFKK
jgi:caffeoyl-CoA O-methyltransferase